MYRLLLISIIIGCSEMVHGRMKKWVPDTNFGNPNNWSTGKLPRKTDLVRFPRRSGTVYVQTNSSFQEMILPVDGELILENYMSISFYDPAQDSDGNLQGQEVTYNGTKSRSWYDPMNWCQVADPEGACLSEPWPCLDTECLPCRTDQAIFPAGSGFLVDLDFGVDIYLGLLSVRGKELSTGEFKSYLRSDRGKQEFQVNTAEGSATNVNIQGQLCTDPAGCPCANDAGKLEKKICAIQAPRCVEPSCPSPLLPHGSCCHICGSILLIDYGAEFDFEGFENMVHNIVPKELRETVNVMVSPLHTGQVQVVIQDKNGSNQVNAVVSVINKRIKADANGSNRYKIENIQISSSDTDDVGNPVNPGYLKTGSRMLSPGSIASLVLAVLAVIAIVLIAMYCLMDRRQPMANRSRLHLPKVSWPFHRQLSEDRGTIELGASVGFNDNVSMFSGSLRSFENPTYDTDGSMVNGHPTDDNANTDHPNAAAINTIDLSQPTFIKSDQGTAFSNPMYGKQLKGDVDNISYLQDATVKINPMFSTEGVEDDSEI